MVYLRLTPCEERIIGVLLRRSRVCTEVLAGVIGSGRDVLKALIWKLRRKLSKYGVSIDTVRIPGELGFYMISSYGKSRIREVLPGWSPLRG